MFIKYISSGRNHAVMMNATSALEPSVSFRGHLDEMQWDLVPRSHSNISPGSKSVLIA
jgi:hypothetical protein